MPGASACLDLVTGARETGRKPGKPWPTAWVGGCDFTGPVLGGCRGVGKNVYKLYPHPTYQLIKGLFIPTALFVFKDEELQFQMSEENVFLFHPKYFSL